MEEIPEITSGLLAESRLEAGERVFRLRLWGSSSSSGRQFFHLKITLGMASATAMPVIAATALIFDCYKIDLLLTFQRGQMLTAKLNPTTSVMLLHGSSTPRPPARGGKDQWWINWHTGSEAGRRKGRERGHVEPRTEVKHEGDIPWEVFLKILREVRPRSLAVELRGTAKEILGQAHTLGLTVGGKSPKDLQRDIEEHKISLPASESEISEGYLKWIETIAHRHHHQLEPNEFKQTYVTPLLQGAIPYCQPNSATT